MLFIDIQLPLLSHNYKHIAEILYLKCSLFYRQKADMIFWYISRFYKDSCSYYDTFYDRGPSHFYMKYKRTNVLCSYVFIKHVLVFDVSGYRKTVLKKYCSVHMDTVVRYARRRCLHSYVCHTLVCVYMTPYSENIGVLLTMNYQNFFL